MADCVSLQNAAELVEELRSASELGDAPSFDKFGVILSKSTAQQAADTIEALMQENVKLKATAIHWHKITSRPLDDEEKEWYAEQGYEPLEMPEFIYDCEMPEDGQEILIATPWGTDKDTCSNDWEYGIGLECHDDFDNVYAWAALPKYEEEEDGKIH